MNKKRISKVVLVCFMVIGMLFSLPQTNIKAAIFGASASNNGNGTTTVTIYGECVGGFTIAVAGQNSNVAKTTLSSNASATFTTGAGAFTVVITAISVSDANYNTYDGQTITTQVNVTNGSTGGGGSSSGSGGGGTSKPNYKPGNSESNPDEDTNVNLSLEALSVSVGTLDPAFSPDVLDYTVLVPTKTTSITVDAKTSQTGMSIDGTGEHKLDAPETSIKVTCKAVEGTETKVYTIKVIVEGKPSMYLKDVNDKKLGVLNNFVGAPSLEGFEDYKFKINGKEVIGKRNTTSKLVLLYMVDEKGNKNFYIYDEKSKKIISIYKPITLLGGNYIQLTVSKENQKRNGFTFGKIEIDNQTLEGWTFKDKNFNNYKLLYLMNDKGETHFYQYEKLGNTLQIYSNAVPVAQKEYDKLISNEQLYKVLTFAFLASTVVFAAIGISLALISKRKK